MGKSKAREIKRLAKDTPYCRPMSRLSLPLSEWVKAIQTAVHLNPANESPLVKGQARQLIKPTVQRIAITTTNYWGAQGVNLPVYFMDGGTQSYKNKILEMFNDWGGPRGGNIKFSETKTATGKEVRIARQRSGYWSYLGPDIFHVPINEQTTNFEAFSDSTPDSEYKRVGKHECGHLLGCPHDQMRDPILKLLDPEKVIAEFQRTQGWSREEVIAQILTPLPQSELIPQSGEADIYSIMCYQFPGSVTKNGKPIPGGLDINDADFAAIARAYPKQVTQPPLVTEVWQPYGPNAQESIQASVTYNGKNVTATAKIINLKNNLQRIGLEVCKKVSK